MLRERHLREMTKKPNKVPATQRGWACSVVRISFARESESLESLIWTSLASNLTLPCPSSFHQELVLVIWRPVNCFSVLRSFSLAKRSLIKHSRMLRVAVLSSAGQCQPTPTSLQVAWLSMLTKTSTMFNLKSEEWESLNQAICKPSEISKHPIIKLKTEDLFTS